MQTSHARIPVVLLAIAIAGCAEVEPDEGLGETASELSTTSWSPAVSLGAASGYGATPGTVDGTTLIVRGGVYSWTERTPSGWTPPSWQSVGTSSRLRASLAGLSGHLYMLRMSGFAVYMVRFDPSTDTWSQPWQLPYVSYDMPALVAFQNQLWILGNTTDAHHQMWSATMNDREIFSQAQLLDGQFSEERVSAAVLSNRLYVAHKQLASDNIIYARFDGTTWTANQFIPAGLNGAPIIGTEPALAAVNGFLHIVYRNTSSTAVKWSYFDTCTWSPEVSIGTLSTYVGYGLAQGGPGLVLTTRGADSIIFVSEFTAPPTPRLPPPCSVIGP